jgi:CubicO group peptidase (beta-lactamase class C family)
VQAVRPSAGFRSLLSWITLHHLLTHSAGLHEYHDRPGEGGDFAERTRGEAVCRILAQALRFAPGTRTGYSNYGYTLLAAVIERRWRCSTPAATISASTPS